MQPLPLLSRSPVDEAKLKELTIVEKIPFQLHRQIDRHPNRRNSPGHFPRDAMQSPAATVIKLEPEMRAFEDLRL